MAEERTMGATGQASATSSLPDTGVPSSGLDFTQGFMDSTVLNGSSLPDQGTQAGLLPGVLPSGQDPALMSYYYNPSSMPYMDQWSSGATQVPPLDPNFLASTPGLSSIPGDTNQYLSSDPMLNMSQPYAASYYMPPSDAAGTQPYTWSDPMMNTLFNPANPLSYTSAQFTSPLDGQPSGTEGLPPVDAAGTMPIASSYMSSTFPAAGMDGVGDLEQSFANLGAGMLGTSATVPGATSPTIPGLVDMQSVMAGGSPRPVQQSRAPASAALTTTSASMPASTMSVSDTPSPVPLPSSTASTSQPAKPQPPPAAVSSGPPKPMSWASIASAAPKKRPPPTSTGLTSQQAPSNSATRPPANHFAPAPAANSWQQRPSGYASGYSGPVQPGSAGLAQTAAGSAASNPPSRAPRHRSKPGVSDAASQLDSIEPTDTGKDGLEKLRAAHEYNPKDPSVVKLNDARFFVIKSYSEDDIHRSIKYSVWTSTEHGNKRLDTAYREQRGKPIYMFFSVNGSGHFCGCARMCSDVDYTAATGIWAQEKWKGKFDVQWIYVKDVPNSQLRHIRLENNENKPVTNSRDTQEVPPDKARQVMKIIHSYRHSTSIFDDFGHYEKRQEEGSKKPAGGGSGGWKNSGH